ncbi:MAG: hypothetical protein F2681_17800 [Actinobacteria bacterium]|uniref:Unannotated protein n=1 Tax=freshwater metagenome TaxID=449393 RepID=A0A6J6AC73_9ZZZZ|nr:hypothetical protein [Actinomycetota bacterium]MSW77425.1 hypothetical protein [Actinomycetota bacterium]MSX56857.1 hypothetical protein [Actinomycetota bacterium]MSX94150.1 hypothetical protein [Actinomycetota bacterium]MSZ84983.1 hypothetical protein [Actinomycetota bacterium]
MNLQHNNSMEPNGLSVTVASHRRSGTHLMLEYLDREFGVTARKTHEFAEETPTQPTVYMVRNPCETLWSTYRWFVEGQSSNPLIAAALKGLSFEQYLRGDGGPMTGFDDFRRNPMLESLRESRGMFYQPIRFWADHVESYLSSVDHGLIVHYEQLVADPVAQLIRVATHAQLEMPAEIRVITRDELVGHAPSKALPTPATDYWSDASLELLQREAGSVMARLGFELPQERTPHRRPTQTAVVRYVSLSDNSGIAVAGRRCVGAMIEAGIDVVWEPRAAHPNSGRVSPGRNTPSVLAERYRPGVKTDHTIMHTAPEYWVPIRHQFGPGTFTGHTVWELTRLPAAWRGSIHAADQVWVPTEWNRTTFLADNLRREVQVVPHVISVDPIAPPPMHIPDGVTVFTTIATWHPRKRPDWSVEAFARAFTKDDPVMLIIKTPPLVDASWIPEDADDVERMTWFQLMKLIKRFPDAPPVVLVNDDFTDAEINGLLARTDCYLSLSASEGWGLGLFDAATLGTPVISTGFGGHLEYLGVAHPGLVPYRSIPIGPTLNSPHLEPDMEWALPDFDAAAAMMRAVHDGTSPIITAAPALANRIRQTYSPNAVGARIASLLGH